MSWLTRFREWLHESPVFFGVARSPQWPVVRATYLRVNPGCAVCSTRKDVEVHHVSPYHLDPLRELDPTNFITLCRPDHLLFGHLNSWSSWNAGVEVDATTWRLKINDRP